MKFIKLELNRTVLSSLRNVSSDGKALIADSSSLHALRAATGKARSPSVERRVDGITSGAVLAKRRSRRPSTSAAREGNKTLEHITAGIGFSPECAASE